MATVLLGAAAPISGPQEVVVRQSASYTRRAVVCFVPAVAFVLGVTQPAAAQDWVPYGTLAPSAHTVSPEVREMPDAAGRVGATVQVPLLHRPSFIPGARAAVDQVAQTAPGSSINTTAASGFDGVAFNGYYPPDPNLSVSPTQIVQTTNVEWAVFDKQGTLLKGPVMLTSLFAGLGNLCSTNNGGDPIVLWDKIAGRWMISQLAFNSNFSTNYVCIAVSRTSDALGAYNLYSFPFSHLPDYPKFGVWSSSSGSGSDYYMSANLFSTALYYGPVVCAFNGGDLQNGVATPRYTCSQSGTSHFSLLPSDLDGGAPPDPGEADYFMELGTGISSTSGTTLNLFPFKATWTSTGGSLNNPSTQTIAVSTYSLACGGGTCIPQPGTSKTLDSLGDRLMYRLAFRNLGNSESLLVNHAVDRGDGTVGIRWYQIQSAQGTTLATSHSVVQQGTYSPNDGSYRWMASIAQDQQGNIGVGYSVSNATTVFPSIAYTGRAYNSADPLGVLGSESTLMAGSGAETGGTRWGDYSSLSLDPADDCTFWYTNEYFLPGASVSWRTRIASFRFASCGASLASTSTTVSSSKNPTNVGESVTFTASVTPSAATGTVTFFDGTTSLGTAQLSGGMATLPTTALAAGSHSISASYSGDATYSGSTSTAITQTVNATGSFTLSASPASQSVSRGGTATISIAVTRSGGFTGAVTLSVSGVPRQSTAKFTTNPIPSGSTSTTLTITTGRKTPKGSYTLTISGTSGSLTGGNPTSILIVQ